MTKPLIGISMGDPAGIGPEIVLKALQDDRVRNAATPVLFADAAALRQAMTLTGIEMAVRTVEDSKDLNPDEKTLLLVAGDVLTEPVPWGKVDGRCGQAAFACMRTAIEWVQRGWLTAIATAPINKQSLQAGGVPFIDHTAMLAHFTGVADPMTLFMVDRLRIFFLTRHISLRQVADALTVEGVEKGLRRCELCMQQLGVAQPKVALAALNPHGGEDGLFGEEEMNVLTPAVALARSHGINAVGPVPADAVFSQCLQGYYDAVLSLYHDQGHIAAKTYDFHRTISLTMGLPFLRTSVDHGTAFDVAGRNIADATGMVEAILAAAEYGERVRSFNETSAT
ncbi:4-hydroxythreonine-4-phosphate dehydrogenase PdxA [candidate division KSB1 bacterium]|nr:4-hydroxythreonine-4-phosphate dehydrogenase PdxA [candidate division KSB1 bacterium]